MEESMEYELSGFSVLASAVEKALKELNAQNYGNAKIILEDALKNTKEFYIIHKSDRFKTGQ